MLSLTQRSSLLPRRKLTKTSCITRLDQYYRNNKLTRSLSLTIQFLHSSSLNITQMSSLCLIRSLCSNAKRHSAKNLRKTSLTNLSRHSSYLSKLLTCPRMTNFRLRCQQKSRKNLQILRNLILEQQQITVLTMTSCNLKTITTSQPTRSKSLQASVKHQDLVNRISFKYLLLQFSPAALKIKKMCLICSHEK